MNELLARLKAEHAEVADVVERFAPAVIHAAPETMEQFLSEVRAEHASYGAHEAIHAAPETMERLRSDLLEAV